MMNTLCNRLIILTFLPLGIAAVMIDAQGTAGPHREAGAASVYWTRARMEHAISLDGDSAPVSRPGNRHQPGHQDQAASQGQAAKQNHPGSRDRRGSKNRPGNQDRREQPTGTAGDPVGTAWQGGGQVAEETGKVFFTLNQVDYMCSGAAIRSPASDVVVTAAHCATDGVGQNAGNWTFVPGYSGGFGPYGSYTAAGFYVSPRWDAGSDEGYDVAFVRVNGTLPGPGLSVAFGRTPGKSYVFGYPSDSPYDGGVLNYCSGRARPDPLDEGGDSGLICGMTAGDSGGPWLDGFRDGSGTVVAVSSFKYSDDDRTLYGTDLGRTARSLYQAAKG